MNEVWSTPLPTQAAAYPMAQPQPEQAKLDEPITPELLARLTAEKLPLNPDGILMLWQKTKRILDAAKADEMEIRKTAVKVYVPKPHEGTNNVELGNGFILKASVKFNYNLDKDNAKVEDALDRISKLSNEMSFIADRLVSWTPNFLVTEYRELQEAAKNNEAPNHDNAKKALAILTEVLTITDGAPMLEIKEPKGKK